MKNKTRNLVITALMIAAGVILPMAFHGVPNAGKVFLPMHIPVLLCGMVTGPVFGLAAGIITPIVSSLATGMPAAAMLPQMICELGVYGLMTGILSRKVRTGKAVADTYISLIGAMVTGRVVYGVLNTLIFMAGKYSFEIWLSAALITALPGIIIQLIAVPVLTAALEKAKLIDKRY